MSDEAAFLSAICELPEDDTARLVFADWLQERGGAFDAAWAQLIRVQVELARGAGAERPRLVERERDLEPLVAAGWSERIGAPDGSQFRLQWRNWSRGFPLTLSGPGDVIRAARPAFAGRVPLREFNVRPATDADLAEFVTWPELALVRKLGVWSDRVPIGPGGLIALSRCPHLCNLEYLRMEQVALTDAAVEAFLDSPHMARVISVKMVSYGMARLSDDTRQRVRERFGDWNIY